MARNELSIQQHHDTTKWQLCNSSTKKMPLITVH